MTLVYSNPDPAITHLVGNAIEQIGVDVVIRGERSGAAMGEIPPVAAWSEVWVPSDGRLDEIERIVAQVTAEPEVSEPWTCPACGETLEGHFGVCWACGTERPATAA